ncbi:esterase/lipase family protein [Nocardia sp. NPDC057668]|uniref:esterase/lipase family protein n=1 Tax=Nocardia sp. NPDC057668 TaxID=3346202 RepID=UPI0036726607
MIRRTTAGRLAVTAALALLTAAAPAFAEPAPAAVNDWSCTPSAANPRPVVLAHGTGSSSAANWVTLAPLLSAAGYCVFAFDYGETPASLGIFKGLGDIPASARTMSDFVDRVLERTGAEKVDVVGHSQGGGVLPNYYIKRLGGAAKVHALVAMAPSNHGTTTFGLAGLAGALGLTDPLAGMFGVLQTPAFAQQSIASPVVTELYADGDTVPGVRYAVIQTRNDAVITPYTNAFLSGGDVTNILLQDRCPGDPVGHIGMYKDGPTMQYILNLLGPNDPGFAPDCTGYGPGI